MEGPASTVSTTTRVSVPTATPAPTAKFHGRIATKIRARMELRASTMTTGTILAIVSPDGLEIIANNLWTGAANPHVKTELDASKEEPLTCVNAKRVGREKSAM